MELSNIMFHCKHCEKNTNTKKPFGLRRNNLRFQMYAMCSVCNNTKTKFLNATTISLLPTELEKMKNFDVYLVQFQYNNTVYDFFEVLRSVLD
jgi:hypothetical protein